MNKDDMTAGFLVGVIAIMVILSVVSAPYLVNQMHSIHAKAQQRYDASYPSGGNTRQLTAHEQMVLRQILNE